MRVIIFSHGHPKFSKGGGEIAAYNLYLGLRAAGHECWFVARADVSMLNPGSRLAVVAENELIVAGGAGIETLASPIAHWQTEELGEFLRSIDPEVVHFHHYVHLGIELIRMVKNDVPKARIVLTLHEYIAICANFGQMIKTTGRLCYSASPRECAQCFPGKTAEDFFLREQYTKSFFGLVDSFVSPSEFLKTRYIDWGLDSALIKLIENGLPDGDRLAPRELGADDSRGRLAYFGQINQFKGIDLILEALLQLPKRLRKSVSLDVYGAGLEAQGADYRAKIESLRIRLGDMVRFHGAYESHELPGLMKGVDWVVMGSIWWENSPVVIQEAFRFGRPIICPDIGGMAEKVHDGVGGRLFRARDSSSLASVITEVVPNEEEYQEILSRLPRAQSIDRYVEQHLELYGAI